MTTAATSLLGLALPVTGELSGTWGDTVNTSITALLDSAVAGTTTLSADADVTLTTTALAANQAREAIILWTAAGTVTRYITAPAQSKIYAVLNKSSTQSIVLRGVGPTTGVTILAGKQAMVAWDGTDYVEISSGYVDGPATSTDNAVARFDGTDGKTIQNSVVIIADTTGNMSGVGTLSSGAITSSSLTATRVLFAGTAGLIQDDADLTFNGTILTSTGFSGALNGTVGATTANTGSFTNITGSANAIISVTDNTNAALRITQLGTGNALLVEDETNPDASPFVINSSGIVIQGNTTAISIAGTTATIQQHGVTSQTSSIGSVRWQTASAAGPQYIFGKSRSGIVGSYSVVSSGDNIGTVAFTADDGAAFVQAATISASVDGTPGTNDMPGRLVFSTTPDGSATPTERMRISSAGAVGIGGNAVASVTLNLARNITGATISSALQQVGVVQADVTVLSNGYLSTLVTQATAFTLGQQRHFSATQGPIGASSAVTSQFGYYADATLTGATNNYGFYSNIAAATNAYSSYAAGTATNYFGGNAIISVTDNTNAALRITQLGTGNALLVEDSGNPDSTPVVIDASGNIIQGYTSQITSGSSQRNIQSVGTSNNTGFSGIDYTNDATTNALLGLFKSRGGTINTYTTVNSGDRLGIINWGGADGTAFVNAARIEAYVDGTPGLNDMPGRLVFSTTADGASSPTERMRIDSAGSVGIGTTSLTGYTLRLSKTITGLTAPFVLYSDGVVQADVTGGVSYFITSPGTVDAATGPVNLFHFRATQGTISGGSRPAVTNQFGFQAESSLTGATNNYGFVSSIASGTNRYNFYAAGTATNYFGGNAIISVTDNTNAALRITQLGTGNALLVEDSTNPDSTPFVIDASGRVLVGDTTSRTYNDSITPVLQLNSTAANYIGISRWSAASATAAGGITLARSRGANVGTNAVVSSGDTVGNIFFAADDGTAFVAAASITAAVDGTPGTNDMPGRLVFSTTPDGAAVPVERMRIDSFGAVILGGSNVSNASAFTLRRNITGGTSAYGTLQYGAIQSDVTSFAYMFLSQPSTATAVFTLGTLAHFQAAPQVFGVGSTVTSQYGFYSASSISAATNNYGFYSGIAAATNTYNFYAAGTADNYFAGSMGIGAVPTSAAKASITSTSAGASTIALSLQNASTTINSETVLDFVPNNQGAGVRSAQITAINTNGGTGVNMLFKIGNAAVPTEAMRLDSVGNFIVSIGAIVGYAPNPASISTTATLTNANIQAQIINTTGTTYTVTMPLGTTLETLVAWTAVNLGYNFTVINTASGTITMAANTGVTTLGALTIATGTSAQFRIRRTAANTFIMYRLS